MQNVESIKVSGREAVGAGSALDAPLTQISAFRISASRTLKFLRTGGLHGCSLTCRWPSWFSCLRGNCLHSHGLDYGTQIAKLEYETECVEAQMLKTSTGVAALVVTGLACLACTDATTGPGGSAERVPANHRASDAQCMQIAAAGSCSCPDPGNCPSAGWECISDSGCGDAGMNGRCIPRGGPAGCFCTYDSCAGDTDCPNGQTCACHGSPYTFSAGNACVPGNCRVDADCGTGGYCSPSPARPCGEGGSSGYCQGVGYYCHTPKDRCIDDADCAGSTGTGCVYSASNRSWECIMYAVPL